MSGEPGAGVPSPFDAPFDPEATQLMAQQAPPAATEPTSAVDALFGEERFQSYAPGLLTGPGAGPGAGAGPKAGAGAGAGGPAASGLAASADSSATGERARASRTQKVLIGVVGSLVGVLALVALFFLGTRIPTLLAQSGAATPSAAPVRSATPRATPSATPTSTPSAKPVGPVAVGIHPWQDLLGGECLNPYTNPWAEKFTVVDCATPHPAQMVFRGTFDPTTVPTFPGAAALQAQISLLCAAPGVLDLGAAGQYNDAQVQGSYPVTQAEWDAGQHDYFCFVSRASAQPLTGSVAVARAG